MCFWYDAELTFQTLESKGVTENIFKGWVEILPEYNQDWDCQRNMFGLASIFKLNVSSIPQVKHSLKKFFLNLNRSLLPLFQES